MNEQEFYEKMVSRTALGMDKAALKTVRNTTVALSGFGGVGSMPAELLARWGVKKFRLLDMDFYEPTNMNRQIFATSKTLNRDKIEVAAERIREINPHAEIEMSIKEMVNNNNAMRFVEGAGVVVQTADRPSAKLLYEAARKCKVPLVNGYATFTGGQIQTFDFRKSECSSKLEQWWANLKFKDMKPLDQMTPEEVKEFDKNYVHPTAASLNFVTNMVGCWIVAEVIKVLTGLGKCAQYPNYLEFDTFALSMKVRNSLSPLDPGNIRRAKSLVKKITKKRVNKV